MILSIIIPVFNKEKYLSRCLDSILTQISGVENKFEIILINDGSSDKSDRIIRNYSLKHKFLSVYTQKNAGVSVARNVGIDNAIGDYLLFLDADDELIDGSLLKVYNYLNTHDSIDMLVTRQTRVINGTEQLIDLSNLKENYHYTGITAFQYGYVRMNAGGGICRKQLLDDYKLRFPIGVKNAEDTIFFGLVQLYSKSLYFFNIPMYRIYVFDGSASRVDETSLALRHVDTVNAIVNIRENLICTEEQKGLIEFLTYQIISNAVGHFVLSDKLTLQTAEKEMRIKDVLPLTTKFMCLMRGKAKIMNFSFKIFYFLNYLKSRLHT